MIKLQAVNDKIHNNFYGKLNYKINMVELNFKLLDKL